MDDTADRYLDLPADQMTPNPVLLHGDLYSRHLVVNDSFQLAGVIDWGDVHVGNAAIDLAIAHMFFPPDAHQTFRQAYGRIDDDTWRIARFRTVDHGLITSVFAREIGDEYLLRESLRSLAHVTEQLSS